MNYDDWKTTDPRDNEPDYDAREELDDYDRADLSDEEIAYLDERFEERSRNRQAAKDRAFVESCNDNHKLGLQIEAEIAFWHAVNALAIEFPEFTIEVTPWPNV